MRDANWKCPQDAETYFTVFLDVGFLGGKFGFMVRGHFLRDNVPTSIPTNQHRSGIAAMGKHQFVVTVSVIYHRTRCARQLRIQDSFAGRNLLYIRIPITSSHSKKKKTNTNSFK
jgi:hypothetical protein